MAEWRIVVKSKIDIGYTPRVSASRLELNQKSHRAAKKFMAPH